MIRIFTSKAQITGEKGESEAVKYLKKEGYGIVERNVANRFGEIDIVAKKRGVTYFFEVKAGKSGGWINPAENLNRTKLQKLFRSVEYYCLVNRVVEYRVRGIIVLFGGSGEISIECIELS